MITDFSISAAIQEEAKKTLLSDPVAEQIDNIDKQINEKEIEINHLKAQLSIIKSQRLNKPLKLREPVKKCLEIDSDNVHYFLKNAQGVYKCVAFMQKIELTTDVKQKLTITLTSLFKENKIGRISFNGMFFYGIPKFFKEDLQELKDEYKNDLDRLYI